MPGPPGFMRVLTWHAPGTYPTRGVTCPDGTFCGQYRQVPVATPQLRYRWPLAGDEAACYRIVGNGRIADGPADALVVEDLAWWEGALYAGGWTLDEDSRGAPCLWRREGEGDWALIWRGEWTLPGAVGPESAEGVRLFATTPALFVRVPARGGIGDAQGLAYTGAMADVGRFEWAQEAGGTLYVAAADARRFRSWGGVVMPWPTATGMAGYTWPWLRDRVIDGWTHSEPVAWRGHLWTLGWRRSYEAPLERLRLCRVMPGGDLLVVWETAQASAEPAQRCTLRLAGNRFGLWGFVAPLPPSGYGGIWWGPQPDRWLHFDGRVMRAGDWPGRALGALGVLAWAGEREAWVGATQDGLEIGGGASYAPVSYTLFKTPRTLCVFEVGVEWGDGSGEGRPAVRGVCVEWALQPGVSWDNRPQVGEVRLEYGDGSGVGRPTVSSVEIAWGDGEGENKPELLAVSIEWAAEGEGPGPGERARPTLGQASVEWGDAPPPIDPEAERVLWLVEEGETVCSRLRIIVQGLTPEQKAGLRVYVRTDREHLPVDAWHTYQVGALRRNVFLEEPGRVVRVGIARPADCPAPDALVAMVRD